MFLSIIIPHYNLPRELLERCITSITALGMNTDDYEIIVVDDASTQPPRWLTGLNDSANIRLIEAPHGGPGAARNRGLETATGEYIQFVDADDMLQSSNAMQQCIEMLHKERPQILRFNYLIHRNGSTIKARRKSVSFGNTISGAAYMRDYNLSGSPCTYFFKRSLAMQKEIRFPENTFHEDEAFNIALHYHAQTLIVSNAPLYLYCIREGSTTANCSTTFEQRRIADLLHCVESVAHFWNSNRQSSNTTQEKGLAHKMATLTVDAIVNLLYAGMAANEIYTTCKERFEPLGIYPLPKANYSLKYKIFRKLANSKAGMRLLRIIVPGKKPAKR